MAKRVVLAYSGGLDTSVAVRWMIDNYGVEVITLAADVGPAVVRLPRDPAGYAAGLYAALHALDAAGLTRVVVTLPPDTPEWLAVLDRLRRAAAP